MTLRSASILALFVAGCSAAVSPDISRLGDGGPAHDAGVVVDGAPSVDFGPNHDAGPPVDLGPGHDGGPMVDGGPIDAGPTCPASCDDGISCTMDGCDHATGTCTHVPLDSLCGSGMRCAAAGCVPLGCTSDASCSDGDPCNGSETCSAAGMCVAGTPPSCNDGHDCTTDSCVTGTGCVHAPNDAACDDGVDCTADTCGSGGCAHAPNDALCNDVCTAGAMCDVGGGCFGGATVLCMADGNPCTADPTMCDPSVSGGCSHPLHDADGDGHGPESAINTAGMTIDCRPLGGDDCNDSNPAIHPGATEVCNGVDDNCNGMIDESGCPPPSADTCATEAAITLGPGSMPGSSFGMVMGNNGGDADDATDGSCGRTGGRDAFYYVDLPATGVSGPVDVTVSTNNAGTDFDTLVAAQVGGTCGSYARPCDDDVSTTNHTSSITFCVMIGVPAPRIHILMDGFDGAPTSIGNYDLTVTVTPHAGPICG